MITITNRDLEAASGFTNFTHPQVKRWAVAFLEPDLASGQHSGISRRYTFEQAFRIYMGGHLVKHLKFSLVEAKQILDDISEWLKKKGWPISKWVHFEKSKKEQGYVACLDWPWEDLVIDIWYGDGEGNNKFAYHSKTTVKLVHLKESFQWQETTNVEMFGNHVISTDVPRRSINILNTVIFLEIVFEQRGSD